MKIIALKLINPDTQEVVNDKRYKSIVKGLFSENEADNTFMFYNNYKLGYKWFEKIQDIRFSDNFNNSFHDSSSLSNNKIAMIPIT